MAKYGIDTIVEGPIDRVKERVVAALKAQGFGVLTEIDVQLTGLPQEVKSRLQAAMSAVADT